MHRYFGFAKATLQLFQHPENVKISIFPLHCPSRNAISSKVFNEFSKKIFLTERWGRWLLSLKILGAQIFWFCNSNVTTFPTSRKCKNFNFSLYTVPAEMLYLQKYLTNFQKLSFGWKMKEGGYCGWKISSAQIFWFCNSNVTTFPTCRKCKNFNFSLYTFPAEILHLQKYLTNFQKLFLAERQWKLAIVFENFNCTDILVLQ